MVCQHLMTPSLGLKDEPVTTIRYTFLSFAIWRSHIEPIHISSTSRLTTIALVEVSRITYFHFVDVDPIYISKNNIDPDWIEDVADGNMLGKYNNFLEK